MLRKALIALGFALIAGASAAGDGHLIPLDTGDDGRGWEGVGRLDLAGRGMCTGALIAPDRVLTAAHCLFDKATGDRIDPTRIQFLAGWRNGRASAYRGVRRAVIHPEYVFDGDVSPDRVARDVAVLELDQPIRNTTVVPFATYSGPKKGDRIGVVSYAHDRADVPSLQEVCRVLARQQGVIVMSCEVDFGSSGAPVFSFDGAGQPRIVSVVSAKAEVNGQNVSLGTSLQEPLARLDDELNRGGGVWNVPDKPGRVTVGTGARTSGAKFVRP